VQIKFLWFSLFSGISERKTPIVSLLLSLIFPLVGYFSTIDGDHDIGRYHYFYQTIDIENLGDFRYEIGFQYLTFLFRYLDVDFRLFLYLVSLFILSNYLFFSLNFSKAFEKKRRLIFLTLFYFMFSVFWVRYGLSQIRIGIASAILIHMFVNFSYVKSVSLIFFSSFFHLSVLILLPLIIFMYFHRRLALSLQIFLFILLSLQFLFVLNLFLSDFIFHPINSIYHSDSLNFRAGAIFSLVFLLIVIAKLNVIKKNMNIESIRLLIFTLALITILSFSGFGSEIFMSRVIGVYRFSYVFLIPAVLFIFKPVSFAVAILTVYSSIFLLLRFV
jgi:hypothetical protein